jgi:hypothetical protein
MNYIAEMQRFDAQVIAPNRGTTMGCTPDEVERLEERVGFELPAACRQWLLWMGRDRNGIFRGTDCFIDTVGFNRELLEQLYGWDQTRVAVPENAFVFYSRQGYAVAWFLLPCSDDDPKVFFFSEGKHLSAPYCTGTFTEFIFEDMRALTTLHPVIQED